MPLPSDYKWIKRWGQMMGSFATYIKDEQERASKDKAPIKAIYKSRDGFWNTVDDIQNEGAREYFMKRYPGECPKSWEGGE